MADSSIPAPNPIIRIERPPMPDSEKRYLTQLDVEMESVGVALTPELRAQIQTEFGA
jgi:hypothetical protein